MPRPDFRTPRLFLAGRYAPGARLPLDRGQGNYLVNVLRRKPGDPLLVFNGADGEWRGRLASEGRRDHAVEIEAQVRDQPEPNNLRLLFAPLKHARLDYMVQKAVEMGVSRLQPVITQHTQADRINLERMRANVVEAAEQCGVLAVPDVCDAQRLADAVAACGGRLLIFCDEDAEQPDPAAALAAVTDRLAANGLALLIGPEGGFSAAEREALLARQNVLRLSLGPRILRADTAAVAALALVQAIWGDWRVRARA